MMAPSAERSTPVGLDALLSHVRQRTGLAIPESRAAACASAVRRAMVRASVRDPGQFRAAVEADASVFDALVDEITIGETYFFRDPRQFDFLRREAIPDIIRRRGPGQALMAWSAGCASGEEPYSLAMLLHGMGLGGGHRILGTDLSRRRLAAARRARYGEWSLRGVPPELVSRYFHRAGKTVELHAAIRSSVQFEYLNLAGPVPAGSGIGGFDLILCRNVLIYLDGPTVERVSRLLVESLAHGGWLLLGPSDPPLRMEAPCEVVVTDAGLAYRRRANRGPTAAHAAAQHTGHDVVVRREAAARDVVAPPARPLAPLPDPHEPRTSGRAPAREPRTAPWPEPAIAKPAAQGGLDDPLARARQAHLEREYALAAARAQEYLDRGGSDPEGWVLLVRALGDAGNVGGAATSCATAREIHPLCAELAVLQSLLLGELGAHDAATAAARSALYLEPQLVVAHLASGNAAMRVGDVRAARRAFTRALRLLAESEPASVVRASGGETVERLAMLARTQLSVLEGRAE